MKKRAAMRDQIPLRRPLFGVEPSGRYLISNRRANYGESQISGIFSDARFDTTIDVVKNSDTLRVRQLISKPVIFE